MTTISDLLADMDRVDSIQPISARAAERLLLYGRVERALKQFVLRETTLLVSVQKFRPALRELSIRLTALEKIAPSTVPDGEMFREYHHALARAMMTVAELERAMKTLTPYEQSP